VNGGNSITAFPYQDNELNSYSTTDTNWHDLYYGMGQNLFANVSASSGNDHVANYFSASYYREQSSVKGNTQQRISARMNNTYKFGKKITLRPSLSASYNINDLFSPGHEYYKTLPIYSLFDNDGYTYRLYNRYVSEVNNGQLVWKDEQFWNNTISERELSDNTQKTFSTDGNILLQYEVIKGLTATAQFGVSYQHSYETLYYSRKTLHGLVDKVPKGYSQRSSANFLSWTNIERVNFNRTFGKHAVSALAGIELSSKGYNTLYAYGTGFVNDHIQEVGYSEADSRKGSSSTSTTRKLSFMAQAGYIYDGRYGLQFSMRREGNSAFGKFARWENYFSVGGTWNIHKERFFDSKIIDMLKIKASFGTSGNSRVDGAQMRGLGIFSYGDSYSYNGIIGGVVATPANPGISWETTSMTNIGVDIRLWKRLSVAVEGYYNYTKHLLSKIYTSRVIGDERIYGNIGELSNMGIEVTISSTNISHPHFSWTTDFNMAHNRNRVEKLADGKSISYGSTITAEGYDSNSFYLVRWAGVDPSTGAPMWYDKNGNLTYTYSTADRVIDKSPSPAIFGGMTNSFKFYDLTLSFQLNYSIGGYALCSLGTNGVTDGYNIIDQNVSINSLDYWRKPGDISANPRISTITSNSARPSTRSLFSTTNIRLQNLSLSYNLPQEFSRKLHMSACRISFIADNLYLWTPDQKHGQNSYKTMMYGYPLQRTFSLSLDLTF
ncbi:MAG: SusC/RagA family TonB-linked outer membrane protein, partial [Alistipes sp.]